MAEQTIKCPKCCYEIPLTAAFRHYQIKRVVQDTASICSDLQGIIDNALPAVKTLAVFRRDDSLL